MTQTQKIIAYSVTFLILIAVLALTDSMLFHISVAVVAFVIVIVLQLVDSSGGFDLDILDEIKELIDFKRNKVNIYEAATNL